MTYGATEGGTHAGKNEGVPGEEAKPGLSTAVSWFPERTVCIREHGIDIEDAARVTSSTTTLNFSDMRGGDSGTYVKGSGYLHRYRNGVAPRVACSKQSRRA